MVSKNAGDGSDERGHDLDITIRIGTDGVMYFNDLTAELLPVALKLCPNDPELRRRVEAARAYERKQRP